MPRRHTLRRAPVLAALAAAALAVPLATAAPASAHGYTTNPPSRGSLCAQRVVSNCGDIQWEPQSVEGPKGFPAQGPADGTICAGGNSRFSQLDDPRGGAWPTTRLTAGSTYTFSWHFTARHATTSFRYFVTKPGWDPTRPLTRSSLEAAPFLTVNYNGAQPPGDISHSGTLPTGRTGHHMILAVWDIADTGNAFYSCSDVTF
ncbi:lytic polysaccharide monooxygenase auxiliary activity family 9 protein [Peterkaempfera bronchialis]|uniref:Chitin-binding protein n=1 Tax=Peterkaempfera bronchialis TaxID=2126346 RepID=A0A345SRN2_9ACTN|nr:lytic polysaccharide monooxygenase [Peterkaempfera bronchialis]AXI76387.1 chitin-binding protein [Peterkaempfera bronchialis]